jgi:hypothetical protein
MGEPVLHQDQWWYQHENGAWSRWDAPSGQWIPYAQTGYYTPLYSSIAGLSRWVVGAIAVDMAFSLVTAMIGLNQIATSSQLAGTDPEEFFQEFTARLSVFNLLNVVTTASGILFAVWFYRAYQNLPALRTSGRYATGWAIGAWLVPILNLFRPKQIADDIWRSSDPTLPENPGNLWLAGKVAPLLHWWWGVWIGGSFAPLLAMPFMFAGLDADDPGQFFARFFGLFMVSLGFGRLAAGALAIPVVKRMTERQEQRAVRVGAPRASA